jgi:hypothetical protein
MEEKIKLWLLYTVSNLIAYLPDIETTLKIISLLVGIGYISWKWVREYLKSKKEKK